MYCLHLLLMLTAHADPIADLAPGPRELAADQKELEDRLLASEAIERAVARLQSTFLITPATDELCRDPLRGPLVVRMRLFGYAWHDAAQRVRVQARRLQRTGTAPTVTPMIDPDRRALVDDLLRRAQEQEAAWLEFVSWSESTTIGFCDLDLGTTTGLPDPIIRGQGEKPQPVAVLVIDDGTICPAGVPAGSDQVVILTAPACWSKDATCDCTPTLANPAAVLGP